MTIVTIPQPRFRIVSESPSARRVELCSVYRRPCQASTSSFPVDAVTVVGSVMPTNTIAEIDEQDGDHDQGLRTAHDLDQQPGGRGADEGGDHVPIGVEGVDALPEALGHDQREDRPQADGAQGSGEAGDARDQHQHRRREGARERQDRDQGERARAHQLVEDDQPRPSVPVEQRSHDGTDEQAGSHAGERDEAGKRRRLELLEREQDDRDAQHAAADPAERHAEQDPAERGDREQGAIGRGGLATRHHPDATRGAGASTCRETMRPSHRRLTICGLRSPASSSTGAWRSGRTPGTRAA